MYNPVKTLQDFTKSIAGHWLNPETKNQYFFSADQSNPSKGEVSIVQYGGDTAIPLDFNLKTKGENLVITVEGAEYEVSLSDVPVHSLYITLSPGNVVRLLKD